MKNKYIGNKILSEKYFSTKNVIFRNITGKNKNILDVGCNEGYYGHNNTEKTNRFYGLDIIEESLKIAAQKYASVEFYDLENLKELSFNQKFDFIIFGDVLEHIKNPIEVIAFFNKYLKKEGKIIISLPNVANWQVRINLLFGKFDYTEVGILDNTHLKLYTFKSAEELAVKSNLKVIKELFGSDILGPVINVLPFLRNLLCTNIILVCKQN